MLRLILLAIVVFLIWAEVIPVRKWCFEVRILLVGAFTRLCINILDFFIKMRRIHS